MIRLYFKHLPITYCFWFSTCSGRTQTRSCSSWFQSPLGKYITSCRDWLEKWGDVSLAASPSKWTQNGKCIVILYLHTRLATKRKIVRQIPLVGSSNDSATTVDFINNWPFFYTSSIDNTLQAFRKCFYNLLIQKSFIVVGSQTPIKNHEIQYIPFW